MILIILGLFVSIVLFEEDNMIINNEQDFYAIGGYICIFVSVFFNGLFYVYEDLLFMKHKNCD